jgi:hypothetical protein
MATLFKEVLLSTSRVIWPAPPRVLTLPGPTRLMLALQYIALAGCSAHGREAWRSALGALEKLVAAFMDPEDRRPDLRRLPRIKHVVRANRLLARRLDQAAEVAHRLVDHDGDVAGVTKTIAAKRAARPGWEPMAVRDVYRHEVAPFLPTIHLLLPLTGGRMPKFAARYPELAPAAVPGKLVEVIRTAEWPFERLDGLVLNDRWVFAALDAAERWRELAARRSPFLEESLVQVRANWTDD